ncbi:hypothetical protein CEQ90_00680 [Lewinellaceae bacterium SD302]|nr:hypothetical protein CEQ90_00680 [Lewinellaceae bacterium SD302]
MPYIFFIFLAIIAGILIPVQSGLNGKLGATAKDPLMGALLSFVVGTLGTLLFFLLTRGGFSNIKATFQLPWYYWTGGLMGAFFVYTLIVAPPRLGIALTLGITVAAQMIFGILLDHYGWLGFPQDSVSWTKVGGALLLIAGVFLLRG